VTSIELGNARYLTTDATVADTLDPKFDRRWVLVDASGHPILQRLHGDRYLTFVDRDREVALDWARQITEAGLETFVIDRATGERQ
jgi:hypothetical protein